MKLLETFGQGHKRRFLDYVNNRLGISKSSYYYYMEYYAFMSKYPKFQNLAVSFRVFRSMIPKLTQWFMSAECRALDDSDFYSEHYWMDVDDVEMDEDGMDVVSTPRWKTNYCHLQIQAMMKQSLSIVVECLVNHQPRVTLVMMMLPPMVVELILLPFSTVVEKFKLMSIMSTVVEKGSDSKTFVDHRGGYLLIKNGQLSMLSLLINVSSYLLVNNKTPIIFVFTS
jgi:hypothetical protein